MPRLPNSLLLLITVLAPSASAIATCWRNDNHSNASSIFVPCNTQTPFSMCYRSQTDAGGNPPDKLCLPNGLVQNIAISGEYQYWRQSCTDQTWASPYCLNAFDACTDDSNGNAQVTPCGDISSTTYCCGGNNTNCCNTPGAITIAAVIGPTSTTSSSAPSSTSTTSPSPSLISNTSSGLSGGAKAGIGIGAALGGIACLVFLLWVVMRGRKRGSRRLQGSNEQLQQLDGNEVHEADVGGLKKQDRVMHAYPHGYRDEPVELGTVSNDR